MNTLKTIYDKLGDKTELAKHEVDLSLVDDFIKLDKENLQENNKASLILDDSLLKAKTLLNMYKGVQSSTDVLLGNIAKFEVKAKELGLDLPKEVISISAMSKAKQKNYLKIIAGITKGIQGLESANSL